MALPVFSYLATFLADLTFVDIKLESSGYQLGGLGPLGTNSTAFLLLQVHPKVHSKIHPNLKGHRRMVQARNAILLLLMTNYPGASGPKSSARELLL